LWPNVLKNIILPQVPKMPAQDRKLIAVGLTRMLTHSEKAVQPGIIETWPLVFTTLAKLLSEPQHLKSSPQISSDAEAEIGFTQIDYEEQSAGYQAAYSRLAASEGPAVNPVAYVANAQEFFVKEMAAWKEPRKAALVEAADQSVAGAVVTTLRQAGAI